MSTIDCEPPIDGSARSFDLLGRKRPQLRIVVTGRLELRLGQRAVVQDDGGGIVRRQQRFEFGFVGVEAAVHGEGLRAKRDADFADLRDVDLVLVEQIEQRRVHALNERRRWPQPHGDALELPMLTEIGDGEFGLSAIHIGVVEAAVLGGEEFAGGDEFLLRQ